MIVTYPTMGILNDKQANSLLAKLIYSIEGISKCSLDPHTQEIIIELLPGIAFEPIAETVQNLIDKEKTLRIIGKRSFLESKKKFLERKGKPDSVNLLFAANGTARKGLAVALYDKLDKLFIHLANRHHAELRNYPSMISIPTLQKCNYISSFPQNIHLVAEIPHQMKSLEQAREINRLDTVSRLSSYALSPTICFHCYAELAGTRLSEPLALTALGTCFRHETPWRLGNHRLNEFKMREVVLFGDADFIQTERKIFMEEVWGLFESLRMTGIIETATDPFYFSDENGKGQLQMMGNMKYELIVDAGEQSGMFSIASFNYMQDSLCKPFEITNGSYTPMHSGCIGFGIDRWVYALLVYHGIDLEKWPAEVREVLDL